MLCMIILYLPKKYKNITHTYIYISQKSCPTLPISSQSIGVKLNPLALVFICLHCKSFENNVGKGESACNKQFLLSPQCFEQVWRIPAIFIKFEIVVCSFFQFGRVLNLSFGKGLSRLYPFLTVEATIFFFMDSVDQAQNGQSDL